MRDSFLRITVVVHNTSSSTLETPTRSDNFSSNDNVDTTNQQGNVQPAGVYPPPSTRLALQLVTLRQPPHHLAYICIHRLAPVSVGILRCARAPLLPTPRFKNFCARTPKSLGATRERKRERGEGRTVGKTCIPVLNRVKPWKTAPTPETVAPTPGTV